MADEDSRVDRRLLGDMGPVGALHSRAREPGGRTEMWKGLCFVPVAKGLTNNELKNEVAANPSSTKVINGQKDDDLRNCHCEPLARVHNHGLRPTAAPRRWATSKPVLAERQDSQQSGLCPARGRPVEPTAQPIWPTLEVHGRLRAGDQRELNLVFVSATRLRA